MKSSLFLKRDLSPAYPLSLVVAALLAGASLAGLLFPGSLYPDEALRRSFVSNDVVNLFIGLPILLGSAELARRGKLIGLLFWPGALFYTTYNNTAYAFALPFTPQFMAYLALVILSAYTIFLLLSRIAAAAVQQRLGGKVPERFAGGVLAAFGALFFLRSASLLAGLFTGQADLSAPELATTIADLLTTPAWLIGGVLLWQRRAFGYVTALGLLFHGSMSFIGLLVFFLLQPLLANVPFPAADFVVIFIMGLVCFAPFGLFLRGAARTENMDRKIS